VRGVKNDGEHSGLTKFARESIHEFVKAFLDEAGGGGFCEVESGSGDETEDGGQGQAGALAVIFTGVFAGAAARDEDAGGEEASNGGGGEPAAGMGADGVLDGGYGIESLPEFEGTGGERGSSPIEFSTEFVGGHWGA
jgi:hypothetical protein